MIHYSKEPRGKGSNKINIIGYHESMISPTVSLPALSNRSSFLHRYQLKNMTGKDLHSTKWHERVFAFNKRKYKGVFNKHSVLKKEFYLKSLIKDYHEAAILRI